MRVYVPLIAFVIIAGCCKKAEMPNSAQAETDQEKGKSTRNQIIHGMTGKTAVDAGQKAKVIIERVSEQKKEDLAEILE